MPKPKKNEKKNDYLSRCMSSDEMNSKHPDEKERYAICNSFWQEHKTKGWIHEVLGHETESKETS